MDQPSPAGSESKTLLEWTAPMRVFKPLDKGNFRRLIIWCILASLVLIFFREFVLVLAIFSLLFFSYVMGTVPPQMINHRITENGVTTAGHTYLWRELRDFYFVDKLGQTVLTIETATRPARLTLILQSVEKNQVEGVLSPFLPHRELAPKSTLDSLTDKAAQLLNLA